MITRENRPVGFEPYQSMTLCSNKIVGGGDMFAVGDVLPLLIGRGPVPKIWLQALASPKSQEFVLLVDASVSRHPAVSVVSDGNQVTVSAAGQMLIHIASFDEDSVVVDLLDLRPTGIAVSGIATTLNVGGMFVQDNTFEGPGPMFAFQSGK